MARFFAAQKSFGIRPLLALLFILFGLLSLSQLLELQFKLNPQVTNISVWVAAIGSIIGGLFMLFRRTQSVPRMKI